MKIKLFFLLFICTKLFSQTAELINKLTDKHQFAKGTKLAIIPPTDFVNAEAFAGFQQAATNASIMVSELPAPFATITSGFTAENLAKRNMTFLAKKQINFQNKPAFIYEVKQKAYGEEYLKKMLVFGDEKSTVLVNFIYPASEPNMETSISKALYSIVYESEKSIDPLADAAISIDISGTNMKFATAISGSYLFTTDGNVPVKAEDKAMLTMGQSISNFEMDDKKNYSINRLKQQSNGDKIIIENTAEVDIDSLKGYEIYGYGVDNNGKKELNYQIMLFSEKKYYILVGLANAHFDMYLAQFKAICKTFKRKGNNY